MNAENAVNTVNTVNAEKIAGIVHVKDATFDTLLRDLGLS